MTQKHKHAPSKYDIKKMIQLRNQGASMGDIAKVTGAPKSSVHLILKEVKSMLVPSEQLEEYRANQAAVMDSIGMVYGQRLLDQDAIKGASALQAASVLGIVTDKSRLIRGESTSNSIVLHANACLSAADAWGDGHSSTVDAETVDN